MFVLCFLDVLMNEEFSSFKLLDFRTLQTITSSSVRQMLLSPFGEVLGRCWDLPKCTTELSVGLGICKP